MTNQTQTDRLAEVLRPIIGIENRTAQEAFDIMCDRVKSLSTDLAYVDHLRSAALNPGKESGK